MSDSDKYNSPNSRRHKILTPVLTFQFFSVPPSTRITPQQVTAWLNYGNLFQCTVRTDTHTHTTTPSRCPSVVESPWSFGGRPGLKWILGGVISGRSRDGVSGHNYRSRCLFSNDVMGTANKSLLVVMGQESFPERHQMIPGNMTVIEVFFVRRWFSYVFYPVKVDFMKLWSTGWLKLDCLS